MNHADLRYVSPLEFREDVTRGGPGRLTGTILPFGRVAGDRREVFTPGSVTIPDGGIALLAEHRGREVMRFVPVERDGELRIDAALPDSALGREVAEEVLTGAAIVASGAYDQATAEVRTRTDHRKVLTWL